jgi:hypothetical protein
VRFIVELRQTTDGVEGEVTPAGTTELLHFSGWLELLRILEPPHNHEVIEGLDAPP